MMTKRQRRKDLVPIIPGMYRSFDFARADIHSLLGILLGYHHPSGEVHITETGPWESCPGRLCNYRSYHNTQSLLGQDNPSKLCTVGDVPNIFVGSTRDHDGPYNGVYMGCWKD